MRCVLWNRRRNGSVFVPRIDALEAFMEKIVLLCLIVAIIGVIAEISSALLPQN